MRNSRNRDFLATSGASESSLLLGPHLWVVHNDSLKCSKEGETSYKIKLTLHACNTEQFACDNAFCVKMEKRCDAIEDCIDGSDEQDCGKLIRRLGYKKELTPVPKTGQSVVVNFSLNILDIEIDEPSNTFTSRVSITREWFDGRLAFKHLKLGSRKKLNTLHVEESKLIWYPYCVFQNIRNRDDWKQTDIPDKYEVIPNEGFNYTAGDNMHVFEGSENALSLTKEFTINWKCEYTYQWYPFDIQVCRMEFGVFVDRTELQPTLLKHNRNISLNRYTLTSIQMCGSVLMDMDAIVVEVTLGRPLVNNVLTVFVPTMLLVLISFAARLFSEDYIDMVIQVNLTILLVLATM